MPHKPHFLLPLIVMLLRQVLAFGQVFDEDATVAYKYIFRLTDEEYRNMGSLYNVRGSDENYFDDLVDSIPVWQVFPGSLPHGHYLITTFDRVNMKVEQLNVAPYQVMITESEHRVEFIIQTEEGEPIPDAKVIAKGNKLPYDSLRQVYWLETRDDIFWISVEHEGYTYQSSVSRGRNLFTRRRIRRGRHRWGGNDPDQRPVFRSKARLVLIPLKETVLIPYDILLTLFHFRSVGTVSDMIEGGALLGNYLGSVFCSTCLSDVRKHRGYAVFSKPVYKPGDTLRMKAFITNVDGTPVTEPLLGNIQTTKQHKYGTQGGVKVGQVPLVCLGNGGYTLDLHLVDSLDLTLDETATIQIIGTTGRKYDYMDADFNYEQYEFTGERITVTCNGEEQHTVNTIHGQPVQLEIEGFAENGTPLRGGRVEILGTLDELMEFPQEQVVLDKRLFKLARTIPVDGKLVMTVPDSLLPDLPAIVHLHIKVLTSDYEDLSSFVRVRMEPPQKDITFLHEGDFILVQGHQWPEGQMAEIGYCSKQDDPIHLAKQLALPARMPVNQQFPYLSATIGDFRKVYHQGSDDYMVREEPLLRRTKDSLFISLADNPTFPVQYELYEKDKLLLTGRDTKFDGAIKTRAGARYTFAYSYLRTGDIIRKEVEIGGYVPQIALEVEQLREVYPGQRDTIMVKALDEEMNPVVGLDLTAFAYSDKIPGKMTAPSPLQGKRGVGKIDRDGYHLYTQRRSNTLELDLGVWRERLQLDTIPSFYFSYPKDEVLTLEIPAEHTQFSMFAMDEGYMPTCLMLEVDDVPVYIRTNIEVPFSFPIEPGLHKVSLRTNSQIIELDSVTFKANTKTVLFVEAEGPYARMLPKSMRKKMSREEHKKYKRYVLSMDNYMEDNPGYVLQGDRVFDLTDSYHNHAIAPVSFEPVTYAIPFEKTITWHRDPKKWYEVAGELISEGKGRVKLKRKFSSRFPEQSVNDTLWHKDDLLDDMTFQHLYRRGSVPFQHGLKGAIHLGDDHPTRPMFSVAFPVAGEDYLPNFEAQHPLHLANMNPGKYTLVVVYDKGHCRVIDHIQVEAGKTTYFQANQFEMESTYVRDLLNGLVDDLVIPRVPYKHVWRMPDVPVLGNYSYDLKFVYNQSDHYQDKVPAAYALVVDEAMGKAVLTNLFGQFDINAFGIAPTLSISAPRKATTRLRWKNEQWLILENDNLFKGSATSSGSHPYKGYKHYTTSGGELDWRSHELFMDPWWYRRRNQWIRYQSFRIIRRRGFKRVKSRRSAPSFGGGGAKYRLRGGGGVGTVAGVDGNGAPDVYGYRRFRSMNIGDEDSDNYGVDYHPNESPEDIIRDNFSDVGYWVPSVVTDGQGAARIPVVYPDDITTWNTFVYAMSNVGASAVHAGKVSSTLPFTAELQLPQFMVANDQTELRGQLVYDKEGELEVHRTFKIETTSSNKTVELPVVNMRQYWKDSVNVTALDTGEMAIIYSAVSANGPSDGEKRTIPVYQQGINTYQGDLMVLLPGQDTILTVDNPGNHRISAVAGQVMQLQQYALELSKNRQGCNEQTASRLIGMVLKNRARGQVYSVAELAQIRLDVRKLKRNMNAEGLWGWWGKSETESWVSEHVVEALRLVEADSIHTGMNWSRINEAAGARLKTMADSEEGAYLIQIINRIGIGYVAGRLGWKNPGKWNAAIELRAAAFTDSLYRNKVINTYQQTFDSYMMFADTAKLVTTMSNNALGVNIAAARMLKHMGAQTQREQLLRGMFGPGMYTGYVNTYLKAQMLLAFEDMMLMDAHTASLEWNESALTAFPFDSALTDNGAIHLRNTGSEPVYVSHVTEELITKATTNGGQLQINTRLSIDTLILGEPIWLTVDVTAAHGLEYAYLQVPIPAGCSYWGKPQDSYIDHREYHLDHVEIPFRRLAPGKTTIKLPLLPRYAGVYSLNPATVSLMYFPAISANTDLKQTSIR